MTLRRACFAVAAVTFLVAVAGIPARSTYGARTSADEPQYLLTARSLADEGDLDISDDIAERAFEPFHEISLNQQTEPVDDAGRQFSPHDPLLPVLLVPAFVIGGDDAGWVLAKVTLAVLAAATAAGCCWVAHRRFAVDLAPAALAAAAFGVSAPMAAYATQVYPEIVAAGAVLVVVAAATDPLLDRRWLLAGVVAVVALPWLSVKYVPVAAMAAAALAWRRRSAPTQLLGTGAMLAVAGVVYLVVHQRIFGGWTVYAAGDHFVSTGEFSVVGTSPDVPGRTRRLVGLLVDRRFGLIPWAPVWALAPAAVALWWRDRPAGRMVVLAPLAAGWATATWVALTMHGWWSPGRQVVAVTPLVAIAVAHLLQRLPAIRPVAALAALAGATNWLVLAWEASTDRRTIIVDFFDTAAPAYRALSWAFAPGWPRTAANDPLLAVWAVVLVATAAIACRFAPTMRDHSEPSSVPTDRTDRSRTKELVP